VNYHRAACVVLALALLFFGAGSALAQNATDTSRHVPLHKTIGQATPPIVPSLIVMNARGAALQGGKLTLTGASPNAIVFADRPVRAAGHSRLTDLLQEWSSTNERPDSFTRDPPNATVSVFSKDGAKVRDSVVTLKTVKLEGDQLSFDVDVLEGDLVGADGPAALFIDRFGGGFHGGFGGFHGGFGGFHGGFAHVGAGNFHGTVAHVGGYQRGGVWDRPYVARGAWYRGAAVGAAAVGTGAVGAAALGAAVAGPYAAAAYPYGYGTCGYYPYPPCY
jgi:hypothetical protein